MSLFEINDRIKQAAHLAGRRVDDIQLLAVSKVQPNENIRFVLQQGHRLFGENKVQEAIKKWPIFKEEFPDAQVHLIGPLQTNKVKQAVSLFKAIHSLDRLKLAQKLADEIQKQGQSPALFIQINTGEESQKAGVLPQEADQFIATCCAMDLPITGLMVIPPMNDEASLHFALLRKIAKRNGLTDLSMGMSSDFEKAIAFGATYIRVGSAIFGARDYSIKL